MPDGPPRVPLFFRHQTYLASAQCTWSACPCGAGPLNLAQSMPGCSGNSNTLYATGGSLRTLLMDIKTLEWDAEQCGRLACRCRCYRKFASSEVYCEGASNALAGVRIAGILGDQQAALFRWAGMDPRACRTPTARDVSLCVMSANASVHAGFAFNGCVQAGSQPKSPRRVRPESRSPLQGPASSGLSSSSRLSKFQIWPL